MAEANSQPKHLDERLFNRAGFSVPWIIFLAIVLRFVSWPIRNFILVCWIYGRTAYIHDGIRVLAGKPMRFSTGAEVPSFPVFVTSFGAFFITCLGLTMLLIFSLRFYERHSSRSDNHAA